MNFVIQSHDICLINMQLCRHYNHPIGFAADGGVRLERELSSVSGDDLSAFASDCYIAVWRSRAFKSLNRATAFGGLNALLLLNCVAIPPRTDLPKTVLGPARWASSERAALIDWLSETLIHRKPDFV